MGCRHSEGSDEHKDLGGICLPKNLPCHIGLTLLVVLVDVFRVQDRYSLCTITFLFNFYAAYAVTLHQSGAWHVGGHVVYFYFVSL